MIFSAPDGGSTPALIVDLDVVADNVERMARLAAAGGCTVRPHAKTHKTPRLAELQRAASATGLTVATVGEAEAFRDPSPLSRRPRPAERGFTGRSVHDQTWRLLEESGELARAVRKNDGQPSPAGQVVGSMEEELVDVLIFLCSIANRLDVDLADTIRIKEAHNETRTWPAGSREAT